MKAINVAALALIVGGAIGALSSDALRQGLTPTFQRKVEMLNPVVKILTASGSGSGTIIHSGTDGTFVLTNHHVLPANDAIDTHLQLQGRFFESPVRPALPVSLDAEVVADDEEKDLALLRVTDPEFTTPYVAAALKTSDRLEQTEAAFVVGAGLGKPVFLTEGLVSLTNVAQPSASAPRIEMLSAPAIYGNSGGAAFVQRDGRFVLAGVPEAIDIAPRFGMIAPVPHMAFAITMAEVRAFLARSGRADLIDPKPQPGLIRRTWARWTKNL